MCTYYEWREDGFVYRARFCPPPPTVVGLCLSAYSCIAAPSRVARGKLQVARVRGVTA